MNRLNLHPQETFIVQANQRPTTPQEWISEKEFYGFQWFYFKRVHVVLACIQMSDKRKLAPPGTQLPKNILSHTVGRKLLIQLRRNRGRCLNKVI